MRLSGIREGDIVRADVRGQHFYAEVEKRHDRDIEVRSLNGTAIGYRYLRGRQVVGHYRKAKGSR